MNSNWTLTNVTIHVKAEVLAVCLVWNMQLCVRIFLHMFRCFEKDFFHSAISSAQKTLISPFSKQSITSRLWVTNKNPFTIILNLRRQIVWLLSKPYWLWKELWKNWGHVTGQWSQSQQKIYNRTAGQANNQCDVMV